MPQKNGQRVRNILAVLTNYLTGVANRIHESGWPTTSEHANDAGLGPKETPLIGGIEPDISNYLTTVMDAGAVERKLLAPVRKKNFAVRRSDSTQALHALALCPNERLGEITTFLIRERRGIVG